MYETGRERGGWEIEKNNVEVGENLIFNLTEFSKKKKNNDDSNDDCSLFAIIFIVSVIIQPTCLFSSIFICLCFPLLLSENFFSGKGFFFFSKE